MSNILGIITTFTATEANDHTRAIHATRNFSIVGIGNAILVLFTTKWTATLKHTFVHRLAANMLWKALVGRTNWGNIWTQHIRAKMDQTTRPFQEHRVNEQGSGQASDSSVPFKAPAPTNPELKCPSCSYRPSGEIKWQKGNLERHIRNVHHSNKCTHDTGLSNNEDCLRCPKSYRCVSKTCERKDKTWPLLEYFKQHLIRKHPDEDHEELIKRWGY